MFILSWQFSFTVSDAAVVALLHFFYWLFHLLSVNFSKGNDRHQVTEEFPRTLKTASKLVGIDPNAFVQYIVCRKCGSIFGYEFGYTLQDNQKVPKQCPYVEYPNHPHTSKQVPCGAYLMKTVETRSGKTTVKPFKVYAYQPLKTAISNLANRRGFIDLCEMWRERWNSMPDDVMYDIYNGKVWKEFQRVHDQSFLESRFTWCFTINTDFFQPFSHTHKWQTYLGYNAGLWYNMSLGLHVYL